MGSQSKIDLAYIAGFLDGDGSLILQIKKRKDGKRKLRFMCTICFYQDERHAEPLSWIRQKVGGGYVSRRNDGMVELRINGFAQVRQILKRVKPFLRFKKKQAQALFKASTLLEKKSLRLLNERELRMLVDYIVEIQKHNYATKYKKSKKELLKILDLTP